MKTVFLAAVAAITFSGSAFALAGINGTNLNVSAYNGTGLNSPAAIDLRSLRVVRAAIRH